MNDGQFSETRAGALALRMSKHHEGCHVPWLARPMTFAGQVSGGVAGVPGVVEYFHSTLIPKATAGIHSTTAATITDCFFNLARKDIPSAPFFNRLDTEQPLEMERMGQHRSLNLDPPT